MKANVCPLDAVKYVETRSALEERKGDAFQHIRESIMVSLLSKPLLQGFILPPQPLVFVV